MTNNDILKRIRYALDLSDKQAVALFSLDKNNPCVLSVREFKNMLIDESEETYITCNDSQLCSFLDGLIILKRGVKEDADQTSKRQPPSDEQFWLSKNEILKKLRIAFNLREEQLLELLASADFTLSKHELSALFRKPSHKHFRKAGGQILRAFLKGLTLKLRP